jgi:tight adherence protein B
MGAGTIVLINALSPGIMRELTTTLPGIVALVLAGTLYAIAFVLIRRITRVET